MYAAGKKVTDVSVQALVHYISPQRLQTAKKMRKENIALSELTLIELCLTVKISQCDSVSVFSFSFLNSFIIMYTLQNTISFYVLSWFFVPVHAKIPQ